MAYLNCLCDPPNELEPPEFDRQTVDQALAAKAGEVAGMDGATYAAEFLTNLPIDRLNAAALALYVTNQSFRDAFAAEYGEYVREQLALGSVMYTALQALSELDKFPKFRAELAEVLEMGRELSRNPRDFKLIGKIAGSVAALGASIELRDALEQDKAA